MPDRSEVIDALMTSDPEPFDGETSPIKYYGPMADAVMALYAASVAVPPREHDPEVFLKREKQHG